MTAKVRRLLCIVKEPGEPARFETREDSREAWSGAVDGEPDVEMLGEQLAVIFDRWAEDGGKPYNCTLDGREYCGTVVLTGVWRTGCLASLPIEKAEAIRCGVFGHERRVTR